MTKTYKVIAKQMITEILHVEASSIEEAMEFAYQDTNCKLIDLIDGDYEINYNDIGVIDEPTTKD